MLTKTVVRKWKSFARDTAGGYSMIFAALIIPFTLILGSAIDYTRAMKAKTGLIHALDSAALAGVAKLVREGGSKSQVEQVVTDMFNSGIAAATAGGATVKSIDIDQNRAIGEVRVNAVVSLPTTFMQLSGLTTIDVGTSSTARLAEKDIELAMVLDLTGSMSGSRIIDLKAAARDLVDILLPDGTKYANKIRIGLVPYSQGVNAGSYASLATNDVSKKCATERAGAHQYSDTSYAIAPIGDGSTNCPKSQIFPLSDSNSALRARINGFSTGGYTAGHTGIGWAWYMLSPKWTTLWPADSDPVAYDDDKTVKVAILMTDGEFNTAYKYKKKKKKYKEMKGNAKSKSEERAKKLCAEMKKKGIEIYSVTFRLYSSSAKKMMENCASKPGNYHDAANGLALRNAFATIAADISQLRISE